MIDLTTLGFKTTYDCDQRHDPWMQQITCRKGMIYIHGENTLGFECGVRTSKQLVDLGAKWHQRGDSECTVLFDLEFFKKYQDVIQPRKRRILNQEQRLRAIERLRKWQFARISPKKLVDQIGAN